MARTLPGTLSTKISAERLQPDYQVLLNTGALAWSPITVAGSAGQAGRSASIITQAGTLLTAVSPAGALGGGGGLASAQVTITAYRITGLGSAPTRSAGITITTDADQIAGVALAQSGSTIRCFYQRFESSSNPGHICYRDSTNDGVTWGAEQVINNAWPIGPHGYVYGIAPASTTDLHCSVAAFDNPGAACYISRSTFSAGAWSAWSNTGPSSIAYGRTLGLRCATDGSGTQHFAHGMQVRAFKSGFYHQHWKLAGSTYTAGQAIAVQDSPSLGLNYPYPTIYYDGASGSLYSCVGHRDDGTVTGTPAWYTRIYRSTDSAASWQLYAYLGTPFQYEVQPLIVGTTMLLCDGLTLYQLPAATPTATDASGDLIALHITDTASRPSAVTLTLDNSSGSYSALKPGVQLTIAIGYAGDRVTTHLVTADSLSFDRAGPTSTVTIHARCSLRLWDIPCAKLLSLKNLTASALITSLAKEVGQTVATLPATTQFSQIIQCFAVSPGETFLTALERVSQIFGFQFFVDAGGALRVYDPQPGDASTWSYGTEIFSSSIASSADQANVIQVIGANPASVVGTPPPFAYVVDGTSLNTFNVERMRVVVDKLLTSAAQCKVRAAQVLAEEQRHAVACEIVGPINPIHELGDVITYGGSQYRIRSQQWAIELHTATWTHTLHCTGK